jgi:CheY-like chemotaxis protein
MLKKFGREILKADTGIKALELCSNNPDLDLILMDSAMPTMDGYEVARQIRLFNTKVIIIAQSAHALNGEREKAIAAGCNDYISKPVNIKVLLAILKKFFIKGL